MWRTDAQKGTTVRLNAQPVVVVSDTTSLAIAYEFPAVFQAVSLFWWLAGRTCSGVFFVFVGYSFLPQALKS